MDHEPMDDDMKPSSDVQRFKKRFENQAPEDTEAEMKESRAHVIDRWESCNRSFMTLFEVLNSTSTHPIDCFDIKTEEYRNNNSQFEERYLRVWKDQQDGSYKFRPRVRLDGIVEEYPELVERFGDTYEYTFGTADSYSAKVTIKNMYGDGVKLEREDRVVSGLSQHETAVMMAAIDGMILPSITNAEDALLQIWDAVSDGELNPVYAKALHAYFSK